MAVRMKVVDLFRIGDKTVFTGPLQTDDKVVTAQPGRIEIDGVPSGNLEIAGEVYARGKAQRDLWTRSPIQLDREMLSSHNVWLVSQG